MKKLVIFVWVTLIVTLSAWSQDQKPDLQIKVLSEGPTPIQEAVLLIFYNTTGTIAAKDSMDLKNNQIIHFEPLKVSIDHLKDTIKISPKYLDHSEQILAAYSSPGKTAFFIQDKTEEETNWLGFRDTKIYRADTTKFTYLADQKKVDTSRIQEITISSQFDYWLLGFWIVFIVFSVLAIISFRLEKAAEAKAKEQGVESSEKESELESPNVITIIFYLVWAISLVRIVFSYSILILIAIFVIFIMAALIHWLILRIKRAIRIKKK